MLKLGLWIGTPPLLTYLASSQAMRLENTLFILLVTVLAVAVGIVPRLTDGPRR